MVKQQIYNVSVTGRIYPFQAYISRALGNALPFALAITAMILFVELFLPFGPEQSQTVMYLLLIVTTMMAVIKSCIPFTGLRAFICVTMVAGTFGALSVVPSLFQVVPVTFMMALDVFLVFSTGAVILMAVIAFRESGRLRE